MNIEAVDKTQFINEIVKALRSLSLYKVILFGSYAYGQPGPDSDIDLIVVLNEDYIPETYNESMRLYLKVSSLIREIKKRFPIDLIVYTKPMYEKSLSLKNDFIKEISERGISLI